MTKVNAPLGKEKQKKNESPVEQRPDGIYEKSTGRKIVSPLDRLTNYKKYDLQGWQIIARLIAEAKLSDVDLLCVEIALGFSSEKACLREVA